MQIQIVSKRDGFRRCGIAHSASPTVYPVGRFTSSELARLKAEPMLVVVELPGPIESGGISPGGMPPGRRRGRSSGPSTPLQEEMSPGQPPLQEEMPSGGVDGLPAIAENPGG